MPRSIAWCVVKLRSYKDPPGGLTAIGRFFVSGWFRLAPSSSLQEWGGSLCVRPGGAAQAADFDKSPDRERKPCQRQDVMQHRACGSRKPCRLRELSKHARHQAEDHEPPRALVAVREPLGGDGEPPKEPRDEDEDDHDDEKRRRNTGGGEQDHGRQ